MVIRSQVLEQSFEALSEVSSRYLLRCSFDITFFGEEGIDSGGLTREWSDPDSGPLSAADSQCFALQVFSADEEHLCA